MAHGLHGGGAGLAGLLLVGLQWVSSARIEYPCREMDNAMANEAPETVEVDETTVRCDGGGALGHPAVYLNMGEKTWVECPYCDRKFVLAQNRQAAH